MLKLGLTHELILNVPAIWDMVKKGIEDPFPIKGGGRGASHATWLAAIENASTVDGARLYSPIIPWSVFSSARVPDGWPGAWKTDEEGTQTERKRFWEYTMSYRSPDETEVIMRLNGPMSNMQIVDGRLTSGNYLGGECSDDLLKKFIAILKAAVPTSDGFLTYNEGQAIIQSWNLSSE